MTVIFKLQVIYLGRYLINSFYLTLTFYLEHFQSWCLYMCYCWRM